MSDRGLRLTIKNPDGSVTEHDAGPSKVFGLRVRYQARCGCGYNGAIRDTEEATQPDYIGHIVEVSRAVSPDLFVGSDLKVVPEKRTGLEEELERREKAGGAA